MRALIQKVSSASVTVEGSITGQIGQGLVILLGITHEDTEKDINYLVEKIAKLRVFSAGEKYFETSLLDIDGEALVVSQFTLYGNCKKGRRPDFNDAAKPEQARELYENFIAKLKKIGLKVETGVFQAMMDVKLVNEGPVTLMIESK